jgi:hypothetical protein
VKENRSHTIKAMLPTNQAQQWSHTTLARWSNTKNLRQYKQHISSCRDY